MTYNPFTLIINFIASNNYYVSECHSIICEKLILFVWICLY